MGKKKVGLLPSGNVRYNCYLGKDSEGKKIYKSFTAPTMREARRMADIYRIDHRDDKVTTENLKGAVRLYISSREAALSPTTIRSYTSMEKDLNEYHTALMKKLINDITEDDIQDLINSLQRDGNSSKTIRNKVMLISAALKKNKVNISGYVYPDRKRPELYVPSDEEMRIVFEKSKGTKLEIPILLAAFGPMRAGEICGLHTDAISGNVVHVYRTLCKDKGHGYVLKDFPKNDSSDRYIEYPEHVIKLIQEKGMVTDYRTTSLSTAFQKFLKANNMHQFRFHDIRHWCASSLHAQGVPDSYICKRGGWSTDTTLKAVYRHTLADQDKIMTTKALDHFNSILKKKKVNTSKYRRSHNLRSDE